MTLFNRAIAAGGKELRPVKDQFYGDRSGTLDDPFGHHWTDRHSQGRPVAGGDQQTLHGDDEGTETGLIHSRATRK